MNESRPYQKSPLRPMMMVLALIVVIPLLLCGGLLTWFFGRQSAAARELTMRVEVLRQSGDPIDDQTLQSFYHSITSDEFTAQWVDVTKQITSEEFRKQSLQMPYFGETSVPPADQSWPQQQDVAAFLERWDSLSKTIHELAQAELDPGRLPVRRPIEFAGIATLLGDTQDARQIARLIALEHDVAVREGDGDRAFACIQSGRGLRRSFDGEPILVSQLVGIAIGILTNEMVQRSLEHDVLSEQHLVEIKANIPEFEKTRELRRLTIQGEVALVLPVFSDPERAKELIEMEGSEPAIEIVTKLRSRDGIFYLHEMEKLATIPDDSMQVLRTAGQDWDRELSRTLKDSSTVEKADKAMSFLLLPSFAATSNAFVREAENNNLARLAIGVRLFRYRFGSWPKSLEQLDQINLSPKSLKSAGDKPFGYRIEDDGVVLWGISRQEQNEIPEKPPLVESNEDANAIWVWRMVSGK